MKLLFEGSYAPTHAFAGFYHWIKNIHKSHAILHFGMHGALEFMPGRQVGMGPGDWPDRLIGDVPHIYFCMPQTIPLKLLWPSAERMLLSLPI